MSSATGSREQRFISRLVDLAARRDRATLAALRRGVGRSPGETPEAARAFYRLLPGEVGRAENDYWLVATLFSLHPSATTEAADKRKPTLADSLARLGHADGAKSNAAERMLMVLLRAERDELAHHLRRAVLLLRAGGISVGWEQLLHDLRWWNTPSSSVQQRWARDFWVAESDAASQPADEE